VPFRRRSARRRTPIDSDSSVATRFRLLLSPIDPLWLCVRRAVPGMSEHRFVDNERRHGLLLCSDSTVRRIETDPTGSPGHEALGPVTRRLLRPDGHLCQDVVPCS
jgi:hypothetical protein